MSGQTPRQFEYLLNALEHASGHENPAEHGYGDKRKAVLAHVAKLEADLSEAVAALRRVQRFLKNGIALGYIKMPDADCPDTAKEVPPMVDAIVARLGG